jgi:hypothetical protein
LKAGNAMTVMSPGRRFGHLVVIRTSDSSVLCSCICQRSCRVSAGDLENGATTSCGCREPTQSVRASFRAAQEERAREHNYRLWAREMKGRS